MTVTLNASTSSGFVMTPDNSGTVAIQGAGTTGLTVNSSGYVLTPTRPAFNARCTGAGQASGILQANSAAVNVGNCYNTSTYRFVAPVAGVYFFAVQLINNNVTQTTVADIQKNGTVYAQLYSGGPGSNEGAIAGSAIISLDVNDYVDVKVDTGSYNAGYGNFCGYLIG
jgi:hypothetical protein